MPSISEKNTIIIIGYSGHAYVACDIVKSMGRRVTAYFENEEKVMNPYSLKYLGSERSDEALSLLKVNDWFVGIGNNHLRKKITLNFISKGIKPPVSIIHRSALISDTVAINDGTMISTGAIINSLVKINSGAIINTGSIVEHECIIDEFAHIAPGAVLAGNVRVGERSFIGANAVVKEGITIGSEVRIGAGSVVVNDIPDCVTVVGNPARVLYSN